MKKSKRKYGRPKKRNLDQNAVAKFLKQINFDVENISQEWRHLTAFGVYQDKPAIFKLASTKATGEYTQHEHLWNTVIHWVPQSERSDFTVPKNYSSGYYNDLFYIIMERFFGNPLASPRKDLSNTKIDTAKIARVAHQIVNLTIPNSKQDELKRLKPDIDKERPPVGEKLLESSTEWASQVPLNLDDFLAEIKKNIPNLRRSPAHGDFVLRQMYPLEDGRIGLIDGEHSGIHGPRYYDVAQLYLRTRVDHNIPDLAQQLLLDFKNLLSKSDQDTFWEELKPPLVERYIGDLWGSKNNHSHLKKLQTIGAEIINNQII